MNLSEGVGAALGFLRAGFGRASVRYCLLLCLNPPCPWGAPTGSADNRGGGNGGGGDTAAVQLAGPQPPCAPLQRAWQDVAHADALDHAARLQRDRRLNAMQQRARPANASLPAGVRARLLEAHRGLCYA